MPVNCNKVKLQNGLRVLLIPMPFVSSVTIEVLVGAGSRYESKSENGIAHFVEHMFFKGTKRRPTALEISKEADQIGAIFGAGTEHELTGFYFSSAAKHLERGLDLLSDILLNSKFDPKEIEREKGVIVEENNLYLDNPHFYISHLILKLLYGDTPLGRFIGGDKEKITKFTQINFLNYLSQCYLAGKIVIVIAGNFDEKRASSLAQDYFSRWKIGKEEGFSIQEENQRQPATKVHFKKTDQAHFALGVRSFPRGNPDRYSLLVLNTILGEGMSSRLFTEVREKRGLAYYVSSDVSAFADVGCLVAEAGVALNKLDEAVKVTLAEFARLKEETVTEEELSKGKEYLKGHLALALEGTKNVADFFGEREVLEGKTLSPDEVIAKVDAVSSVDIKRVAKEIFVKEHLNLAVIGPYKSKEASFGRLLAV